MPEETAAPRPSRSQQRPTAPAARNNPAQRPAKVVPVGHRLQAADVPDPVASAVAAHGGDVEAATAALV